MASCKTRGPVAVLVMLLNAAAPKLPLGCENAGALVMLKSSTRRTWRVQNRSRISQTDDKSLSVLSAQSTNGVVPGWSATQTLTDRYRDARSPVRAGESMRVFSIRGLVQYPLPSGSAAPEQTVSVPAYLKSGIIPSRSR